MSFVEGFLLMFAPAIAWAQSAVPDTYPTTWHSIVINLVTVLPATVAAVTALLVSWRSSSKVDSVQETATKVEHVAEEIHVATNGAVAKAKEVAIIAAAAAAAAADKISTAAEDVKRAEDTIKRIEQAITASNTRILDAIEGLKRRRR